MLLNFSSFSSDDAKLSIKKHVRQQKNLDEHIISLASGASKLTYPWTRQLELAFQLSRLDYEESKMSLLSAHII